MAEWIEAFHARIFQYRSPGELFGRLPPGTLEERHDALDARRAALLAGLPSSSSPDLEVLLDTVRRKVDDLSAVARGLLEAGTYDEGVPGFSAQHGSELRTSLRAYRVLEHLAEGEHADIYRGEYERTAGVVEQVAIKIPRRGMDESALNESRVLGLLSHKSLPILVDTFRAENGSISTIMRLIDGVDLHEVKERYPDGLPQEHLWWILDRLLSVLGFLHSRRVIHGAIEPGNVMLRPRDHNAFLVDFLFAVVDPARSGQGFRTAIPGFSGREVAERRSPAPPADIYSLGKTMIWLAGGDIARDELPAGTDARLRDWLLRLVDPDPLHRPRDAWELCREVRLLRERVLGEKRPFLELVI